jgi:hypothetical protein
VLGQFRILFLYDVAEAIRLDALRSLLKPGAAEPATAMPSQIPQYLKFERPPVVEPIEPILLAGGERVGGSTKYYDYGVVSVEFELPLECDWDSLMSQCGRWIGAPELDNRASEQLRGALQRAAKALTRPYQDFLREDYYILQLGEIAGPDGKPVTAGELLASRAREITQLVRGEAVFLSDAERQEVLQSTISYSQTDLLVVGWSGALVYGSSELAGTTVQLLEYANTQLLEFRYYDGLLTRLLEDVYGSLEHKSGVLSAWRLSQEAARLNTIRLDVMELTEKVDNAIKFLSDMFYARLYGLAAAKVGVPDYRRLVETKLRTAGELYRFMMDQFNQTRSFVLELAVVIILIVDLLFLFRGK